MGHISTRPGLYQNTRRWARHQVDLPVRIVARNGILTTPVLGRGSEISRAGMALRAAISLKPGDLMQLQFPTSGPSRVTAVVRNRTGDRLGLEFVTQLPSDDKALDQSTFLAGQVPDGFCEVRKDACLYSYPQTLYDGLRRKRGELRKVQREIEALHLAIRLLADDENDVLDSI